MADENLKDGQQSESQKTEAKESTAERVGSWLEKAFNTVMRDGTIAALGREAWKDLGDTWYQIAYGQVDNGRELGSPLTPLASDLEEARGKYDPAPSATGRSGQAQEASGSERSDKGQALTSRGQGGDAQDKGGTQYAQVGGVFVSELPPTPLPAPEVAPIPEVVPTPEPMPAPSSSPQTGSGNWADRVGGAPEPRGPFTDAVEAERGQSPGGNAPWLERIQHDHDAEGNGGGDVPWIDRIQRGGQDGEGNGGSEGGFVERVQDSKGNSGGDAGWIDRIQRGQDENNNENGGGDSRGRSLSVEQMDRDRSR